MRTTPYLEEEILKYKGTLDDHFFYTLEDGSYFDPDGYYFNSEGFDFYGGYYDMNGEYKWVAG